MSTSPDAASFEPPGPGLWSLDTAHFPQPATRFTIEVFPEPARRGFAEATARYGLLLDFIEWAFVQRWAYLRPRPVWSLGEGVQLTRERWEALVAASPALRDRLAVSSRVFDERSWRVEMRLWDDEVKPAMRRGHLALQAAEPDALDTDDLWAHIDNCRENLRRAIYHHHRLNVAPVVPAGDFLVHAQEWTGRPAAALVRLLRGDGPLSLGAAAELDRLAGALRDDPSGAALVADDDPADVLSGLLAHPGRVGDAAEDYLGLTAHWSAGSGFDVGEPSMQEMPALLVQTIRSALERRDEGAEHQAAAHADGVRADVDPANRDAFDELLAEARACHRVRDERALFCDVWAYGLARRAILAAGRRLAASDAVEEPAHLVEAGHQEMRSLLLEGSGPSADELAGRARYRRETREDAAPSLLGNPGHGPVPPDWLPPGAARTERAFRAYVGAMSAPPWRSRRDRHTRHSGEPSSLTAPPIHGSEGGPAPGETAITGLPASPGRYGGPARLVRAAADLGGIEKGDVLVAGSTTPAFNAVLPLVGAIVTDRGGLLSHAAIVAREYGIPAVVGTGEATRRIEDGAQVLVDGTAGQVSVRG